MKINKTNIEKVLEEERNGLSLESLMVKLHLDNTNDNRLQLTSLINWNKKIERNYVRKDNTIITIYCLNKKKD
ncbi:hypothetical protein D7L51_12840 [Enterococcus faecalis]|nr:hypothetical protein [Enterococcus faecalis]